MLHVTNYNFYIMFYKNTFPITRNIIEAIEIAVVYQFISVIC